MKLEYLLSVRAQEVEYLSSEKLKCKGGTASHYGVVATKYPEADRSKNECHICIPLLEELFYPAFNQN
jgi:hypothetical protein